MGKKKDKDRWRAEFKRLWGVGPPPHSQEWMAIVCDMHLRPNHVDERSKSYDEFVLFCKTHKNYEFSDWVSANAAQLEAHEEILINRKVVEGFKVDSPAKGKKMYEWSEEFKMVNEAALASQSKVSSSQFLSSEDLNGKDELLYQIRKEPVRFLENKDHCVILDELDKEGWSHWYFKRREMTKAREEYFSGKDFSTAGKWKVPDKWVDTIRKYGIVKGGSTYQSSWYEKDDVKERMKKASYTPKPYKFAGSNFDRTFIVGDIHGCLEELKALMDKVHFNPKRDRLISVGDVVDRGPDIHGCFEYLREMNAWLVLGNHEEPFIKWKVFETLPKYEKYSGKNNPIDLTTRADQKDTMKSLTQADWESMFQMQLFFELPEYAYFDKLADGTEARIIPVVVHGGLFPGGGHPSTMDPFSIIRMVSLDSQNKTLPLGSTYGTQWWEKYNQSPAKVTKDGETVVYHAIFGHSTFKDVHVGEYTMGLDTGAVYGGQLSCVELPSWEVHSVPASKQWYTSSAKELSGKQTEIIGSISGTKYTSSTKVSSQVHGTESQSKSPAGGIFKSSSGQAFSQCGRCKVYYSNSNTVNPITSLCNSCANERKVSVSPTVVLG